MVEEEFIRAEFHCGWRVIEKPDGYTFMNLKGQVMPHRFWKVSDFDEETGVAQVEFMTKGKGCVTFDGRVLPLPFDGELVDKLTDDKSVYKIRLPHKRIVYRVYDRKTEKLEDKFSDWSIVKTFKDGSRLVSVSKNTLNFVHKDGRISFMPYRHWIETADGTIISANGTSWLLVKDEPSYLHNNLELVHQDEKGMHFTGCLGSVVLTKDGEFVSEPENVNLHRLERTSTPVYKNPDVLLHSLNVTVYKKKGTQKYHTVALDIEGQKYTLEALGEDLKVSGAYKNNETKRVYLYGRHDGEEPTWWSLDGSGNVEKLHDIYDYGYDKYGSIVSKGKTIIYKARDIENQSAKSL